MASSMLSKGSDLYSSRHASETQAWLLGFAGQGLKVKQDNRPEKAEMMKYPRSPKALLGGIAHLGRFIDKIRMRHAGKIQDYNYITVGFDKYLIDFLQIDPKAFEQRVLAGGTDDELLTWVKANSRKPSDQEISEWNQRRNKGVSPHNFPCAQPRARGCSPSAGRTLNPLTEVVLCGSA